jgi:hypothetical protein
VRIVYCSPVAGNIGAGLSTLTITIEGAAQDFADRVAPALGARLKRYDVAAWSREYSWQVQVTLDRVTRPESVLGVDPALLQVRPLRVVSGRWLTQSDVNLLAPTVVVNTGLVGEFGGGDIVGRLLRLRSSLGMVTARVVGVVDDANQESRLYSPVNPLVRHFGVEGLRSAGAVVHVPPDRAPRLVARIVADAQTEGLPKVDVRRVDAIDDFRELFARLDHRNDQNVGAPFALRCARVACARSCRGDAVL